MSTRLTSVWWSIAVRLSICLCVACLFIVRNLHRPLRYSRIVLSNLDEEFQVWIMPPLFSWIWVTLLQSAWWTLPSTITCFYLLIYTISERGSSFLSVEIPLNHRSEFTWLVILSTVRPSSCVSYLLATIILSERSGIRCRLGLRLKCFLLSGSRLL